MSTTTTPTKSNETVLPSVSTEYKPQWRQVAAKQFFEAIGHGDVHPQIQPGPFPYTSLWKTKEGRVVGKSTGEREGGLIKQSWFLPND